MCTREREREREGKRDRETERHKDRDRDRDRERKAEKGREKRSDRDRDRDRDKDKIGFPLRSEFARMHTLRVYITGAVNSSTAYKTLTERKDAWPCTRSRNVNRGKYTTSDIQEESEGADSEWPRQPHML